MSIEVLDDPLAAAELGDTVLAAQAFQHKRMALEVFQEFRLGSVTRKLR